MHRWGFVPPLLSQGKRWDTFVRRVALLLLVSQAILGPRIAHASALPPWPTPPPRTALVLEPFADELGLGSTAGQAEVDLLQKAGYTVTVLRGDQVTVSVMRHLSAYSFIYILTHSGPLPNNDAAVATGETQHQKYAAYFRNYSMVQMHIADPTGTMRMFDAVTGRFIHQYDGTFPSGSIVYIDSCNALDMPRFWTYLHQRGVATLISWHHHVDSADAERAAQLLVTALAAGKSVHGAIQAVKAARAGTSNAGKKPGWLSFAGSGTSMLHVVAPPAQSQTP